MEKVRYHTLKLESMYHANAACQKGSGASTAGLRVAAACNVGGDLIPKTDPKFNFCYATGVNVDAGPDYYECQGGDYVELSNVCNPAGTGIDHKAVFPCGSGAGPQ